MVAPSVHAVDATPEVSPSEHFVHADAPATAAYVSMPHALHVPELVAPEAVEKYPAAHAEQAAAPATA